MMTKAEVQDKTDSLTVCVARLRAVVQDAVEEGSPLHQVEREVWQQVLALGQATMSWFLKQQGTGDVGATATKADGADLQRLPETRTREYLSIFGGFQIERTVYGTRNKQRIDYVPLDERLGLPESKFSYLLQDWSQMLAVEQAFGQVRTVLQRMLGITITVDSLERMSRHMAEDVADFRHERSTPPAHEEGTVFVASGDGKGIPLRRDGQARDATAKVADELPDHHPRTGPKPGRKQMAIVGTAYSVDRYIRTPRQVLEALFRDPRESLTAREDRPRPCHKHVWASLTFTHEGRELSGMHSTFAWLANELAMRNPGQVCETVCVMDGQESLWDAADVHLPPKRRTDVLDLLHVVQRVWEAAHVFHATGTDMAKQFAREKILRILSGEVGAVIRGLRRLATLRRVGRLNRATIEQICNYFDNNRDRMRYHEYLARGYPIASGAVEGACRHLVKDRLERAGMRWVKLGAQAMLDLRSTWINGDWQAYQSFRITRELHRLHPNRELSDKLRERRLAA